MELLYEIFVQPFWLMISEPVEFLQIIVEGIMAGVLYSLVALGFALIYKASGVFNFAQGMFVVFAALALIAFSKMPPTTLVIMTVVMSGAMVAYFQWKRALSQTNLVILASVMLGLTAVSYFLAPIIMALMLAVYVMILVAFGTERVVLRPLVNQPQIILFMATIGLFFFMEGFGETVFGGGVGSVPMAQLGMERATIEFAGLRLQQVDLTASVVAGLMVVLLALMFQYTGVGRALRAVADDHQAALSVGIPLNAMWVIVWSIAGVVALVAGIMWGSSAGSVSFSLVAIALKALPVLILGGFTSIPGVIVGGFIIGIGEKVFEIYWDDVFPGTTEEWFAYVLALIVLLFRPQGLFGEKIIERV